MKATKYTYIKEIIIPDYNKYYLSEIVLQITDICYKVYYLYYNNNYKKIGEDLINNTLFNYNSLAKHLEIKFPIEQSSKYFFQFKFFI